MNSGINVWTWGIQTKVQFEQALREVSDLDYEAVENLGIAALLYADSPDEFGDLLATHGISFACAYHLLSNDRAADYALAERILEFLGCHGVTIMNLQAAPRPAGGPSEAQLSDTAAAASHIAGLARPYGVTVCLHPHFATMVEREHELTYLMDNTDPHLVYLTLDTAHAVLGGMDPLEVAGRYANRIRYVHMKDVIAPEDPTQHWTSGFRELGRGALDFRAIVNTLRRVGYDGILCVELDNPRVCGYKSAAISRQYMREELGV